MSGQLNLSSKHSVPLNHLERNKPFNMMIRDYLKSIPHIILPKHGLTLYAGLMANAKIQRLKNRLIRRFIEKHGVNMQEAEQTDLAHYACFNDFFIRHLKPGCRTISAADIVSPVDGSMSELGDIDAGKLLQAKGRYYSVEELLACDKQTAQAFHSGHFMTLYLSPKDYHRVHMPITGRLTEMTYVPGRFYSVKPALSRVIPNLFARNQRLVVTFQTPIGPMVMVLVGATVVGRIGTTWEGDIKRSRQIRKTVYTGEKIIKKGEEMGYFKLGSTVILLFSQEVKMRWLETHQSGNSIRLGEALGQVEA